MRHVFLPCCLLAAICFGSSLSADEAGLRKTLSEFVAVFNQQDSTGIAAFWTETATHTDRETGERTEGRDAIQADFKKVFAEKAGMKLTARADRIKIITPDVASVEGQTTVVSSDTDPVDSAFTAILVRKGDKWLFDSVDEMAIPVPETSADALKDLEWLVGDWIDESDNVKVRTSFRWSSNQAFLLRSFIVETKAGIPMQGTQVIGWDPRGPQIRSWTFNSDGSFGEATWSKNGNSWLTKSTQTATTGDISAGTYVLEQIDDNSFTLQLIGHEVNGEPQPAGDPVKIVRAPIESAPADASSNNK